MAPAAFDLDAAIARVAGIRRCRMCGGVVPASPGLCPTCNAVHVVIPHAEWDRDLKRFLCVRAVERKWGAGAPEQYLWDLLLLDNYRGEWRGEGEARHLVPRSAGVDDVFTLALQDTALWVAAGRRTIFTI